MKNIIIDWAANSGEWKTGIVVRNHGHRQEPVAATWCRFGTAPSPTQYKSIPAWGVWIVPIPAEQTGAVLISGSDDITVIATTRRDSGGYGFVPVRYAESLSDIVYPFDAFAMREWKESPFWILEKGLLNPCRFSRSLQQAVLQHVITEMFFQYPDRKERRLSVMEACPLVGDCAGHPAGSHNGGLAIDVRYYTHGPGEFWTNGSLNKNFDFPRNTMLFKRLHELIPKSLVMVDERIAQALGSTAYLQGDSVPAYHHDTHAHIVLGDAINAGAMV